MLLIVPSLKVKQETSLLQVVGFEVPSLTAFGALTAACSLILLKTILLHY